MMIAITWLREGWEREDVKERFFLFLITKNKNIILLLELSLKNWTKFTQILNY